MHEAEEDHNNMWWKTYYSRNFTFMQQNTYLRFSSLCRLLGDCCLHACLFIDLSLFVVLHFICLFFIWYIFTIVACDMLFRQIAVKVYITSGCYSAWSFCTCHFLIPELWYAHKLLLDELIVPYDPQPHGQVMASVFDIKLSANSGLSGRVSSSCQMLSCTLILMDTRFPELCLPHLVLVGSIGSFPFIK